jgi:hypothetical protein
MNDDKSCNCGCPSKPKPTAANSQLTNGSTMRSVFRIPGMDCPSEEQMIRLRLADAVVGAMTFDLPGRTLVVDHAGDAAEILQLRILINLNTDSGQFEQSKS